MQQVIVGQRVEIESKFYLKGVLADPVVVTCTARRPNGGREQFTYPSEELTRSGVGEYRAKLVVDAAGTWAFRFDGAGTADAVGEVQLRVLASTVLVEDAQEV